MLLPLGAVATTEQPVAISEPLHIRVIVRTMACKETNFEDLYDNIDPAILDRPCQEKHLNEISDSIPRWEELTPYLDLTDVEVEDIKETNSTPKLRRRALLKVWKQKKGKKATYRELAKLLASQGRRDVAETLCEMVKGSISEERMESEQPQDKGMGAIIAKYGDHLRGVYQTELGYHSALGNLPSPTHPHVFNLALISQRNIEYGTAVKRLMELILKGEVEEILGEKKEVKLENIFQIEQPVGTHTRKFILFEGAPGAGKSTLACFICQKWGAGELFQEYNLVVFIRLNDPLTRSAQSLADVFHSGSHFDTQQIVSHLQSVQGQGVLFVLDGWDEYSPQLKEGSLFEQLICASSKLSMQLSSVIVTSRPVASGQLQRFCSARIQVIGFKPEELKRYFQEALKNDHDAIAKLEQCLKEKPLIQNCCCTPLNAAIVAHTFLSTDGSLPATMYDLFKELVSTVIQLHMEKASCTSVIDTLDRLPSPFKEQLESLCRLAYDGVMKNNVTFSDDDLKSHGISPHDGMLSLLHGTPSFILRKQSVFYQFLHLTMQEFLATHYILQLPLQEQFKAFQSLFGQPRFVACFQFYASQINYIACASEFCSFFARVFEETQSHVDKKSLCCPKKLQGSIEQLTQQSVVFTDISTAERALLPRPLSSFDPLHIVLYCPLPFLDVGYALVSLSVTQDKDLRIECCACIDDDAMMYFHVSGIHIASTSQNIKGSSSPRPPYNYSSVDLINMFSESERDKMVNVLPKSFLAVKDRFLLMTFKSDLFFNTISDMFKPDGMNSDIDYKNIICFGNWTDDSHNVMENVGQEYVEEHCQTQ